MKSWHMLVCVGFIALAAILIATGAGALAVVAIAGCALMMGAMVWMMVGGGRGSGGER